MKTDLVLQELREAIVESGEIRAKESDLSKVEAEIAELEQSYQSDPSPDKKIQLLARYVLLSRLLPVVGSTKGIEMRERFQQQFPDHFKNFMEIHRSDAATIRWSGCLLCKHSLGQECSKGLQPRRLPSRYLNRDYACSAFEEKTG